MCTWLVCLHVEHVNHDPIWWSHVPDALAWHTTYAALHWRFQKLK